MTRQCDVANAECVQILHHAREFLLVWSRTDDIRRRIGPPFASNGANDKRLASIGVVAESGTSRFDGRGGKPVHRPNHSRFNDLVRTASRAITSDRLCELDCRRCIPARFNFLEYAFGPRTPKRLSVREIRRVPPSGVLVKLRTVSGWQLLGRTFPFAYKFRRLGTVPEGPDDHGKRRCLAATIGFLLHGLSATGQGQRRDYDRSQSRKLHPARLPRAAA